ncbi:DMT family transporter [Puniceibacterium sp. IMCC21224]|uniref:DMT family transporter n=1 Tax=Puniceibacterium sp. IMCC21224 TaxID=1618204 RepID=UPI00064DB9EC|nr:DMT family transporter [Puniceibacterium sp. IMCC21224]KMK67313.1 EamA-like transporter family [Puniceibacterium sp. IMCC21224]
MTRNSNLGLALATFGALVLGPDALLLRLSDMQGMQMLGWRGLCMGGLFLMIWLATSRNHRADLAVLGSGVGMIVVISQSLNAMLFPNAIALAPVSVVLLAIATVPVWSALLARLIYGESTSRATWITILLVLSGIAIAVSGKGDLGLNPHAALGALLGLGVAAALATTFVTLRHAADVPILLTVGLGALIAGIVGTTVTGPAQMTTGTLWPILLASIVILPLSFFALSLAARHTAAANVSLLMLLETVLGPVWVWYGTSEAPTPRMLWGGLIVLVSLALYLNGLRRAAVLRRAQSIV